MVVIGIIVVTIFIILAATYILTIRFRRNKKSSRQTTLKTAKLPSLWDFSRWRIRPRGAKYSSSLQDNELDRNDTRDPDMSGSGTADPERSNDTNDAGVDRNTSVRSVMTLPAYSPAARENERILGREGERAGIDTVLEFPETQDDEEQRREGEMESLYQIRLARRQEAREREERRRLRREARARGDTQALAELRRQAEIAAEMSASQLLIAEHQSANRDRRVSSVQYAALGVARHDGTRLRANSSESDRAGLLDSAASISGLSSGSRGNTLSTTHHHRIPSNSSALSISSTRASDDFSEYPRPCLTHHRTTSTGASHMSSSSAADDYEVISLSHARSRSASRAPPSPLVTATAAEMTTLDSSSQIPGELPPMYDELLGFEDAPP